MIKVFTLNNYGKIEFTKEELEKFLKEAYQEAYWDGYHAHSGVWTYTTPSYSPYKWEITTATSSTGDNPNTIITCNSNYDKKDSNLKNEI